MSARIAGLGWITTLGADLGTVWERLMAGEAPERKPFANPETGRVHEYLPVPPKLVEHLGRNPRLRRSSAISYYAVAAGLAALEHAGLVLTPEVAARTAVVFAISNGGVLYTRRFFEQIIKGGANAASPLLFAETVYNAPASHLAAQLEIDGASYTLVGDASVGLTALRFGEELIELGEADHCIVVGAEECDWILCEAYRDWRLARTPLAEGAAAVVLSRAGRWSLHTHPGVSFFRQRDAATALEAVLADLARSGPVDLAVCSANGTFVDRAESSALARWFPRIETLTLGKSFGAAPGASALLQVITAALAVERKGAARVLVSVVGCNQQASAAIVAGGE
ncbi:MAG: hypothetical protein M3463_11390 [Verrucomicrobiota bacterium]|nr:hypothetical protein [Verrucomicrobiota bacterium]